MTVKDVAVLCGVSDITVRQWCHKNGIARKQASNGMMEYTLSKKDIEAFEKRNKKKTGRPRLPDNDILLASLKRRGKRRSAEEKP